MNYHRIGVTAVAVGCVVPLLLGLGGSPPLRDSRFAVTNVTIAGPATIANGGSANYTVTATIQRDGIGANEQIVGTQGPPPPRVRPSLYVGNTQLTRTEVNVAPNVNTITVTLALTCSNNEVRGNLAGSGHGGTHRFLFWSWTDPAQVKGHLNERESTPLNVLCTGG